jgi:ankyrin repeat protein
MDPRKQNKDINEWVHSASSGRLSALKELHKKGIDINTPDFNTGNTGNLIIKSSYILYFKIVIHLALHFAVIGVYMDVAKWLVEKGVTVNAKNRRGQTALHISIESR